MLSRQPCGAVTQGWGQAEVLQGSLRGGSDQPLEREEIHKCSWQGSGQGTAAHRVMGLIFFHLFYVALK